MAILYVEHNKFFGLVITEGIQDLTVGNEIFVQGSQLPPSDRVMACLNKSTLLKILEPWHSGYSVQQQTKSFLRSYINRHWKLIYHTHLLNYNQSRARHLKLKSIFEHHFKVDDEITKDDEISENDEREEEESCEQDPEVEVEVEEVPYDTNV